MVNLSLIELKLIANIRGINGYERMSGDASKVLLMPE